MFRSLASAVFMGLALIPGQRCFAEQRAPSLKDTFKAILASRAPPVNAAAAWVDSLADDLVESLSELLTLEKEVAVTAGPEAAAWVSFMERLKEGGPLEGLGARDGGQATPAAAPAPAPALAAREVENALFGEPRDLLASTAGGQEKGAGQERVVPESRMLRGEQASSSGKVAEPAVRSPAGVLEWGGGRRTLIDGGPAAAAAATPVDSEGGGSLSFAECPEVVGTVGEEDFLKIENTWVNVVLTALCVVCAGLAAGLTMGLLSIEPLEMAIKQRSGTPEEQLQASRILPLVSRHHFLLVTLLLFNSLANEALPIFLGNLVPSWVAVILSVSLVLFFGEIFPSAVFTGKNQLAIAAGMSWLVYTLMMVLGPVAWPISWMLDRVLGIEGFKRYNRAEISALVEVQQELSCEDATNLPLHADEVSIVNGVLLTAERSVSEAMITMDKVFCLGMHEKLSGNTMADIMAAGYSRVLVYEGEDTRNIRGYLQVKKLIILDPDDERTISSLMLRVPVVVSPNKSLLELLNTFQTGKSHLALVSESPAITLEALKHGVRLEGAARPVGIITLEDIIEEIIQEEIMDESDRLTQFIEDRAKDTLLRFARKRQERLSNGQINPRLTSMIGNLGTPRRTEETTLLKRLGTTSSGPPSQGGTVTPPSPSYQSLAGGNSFPGGGGGRSGSPLLSSSPPAPQGIEERASLLESSTVSGSQRRLSAVKNVKRGSATVGQAMLAAANRARENSGGSDRPVSSRRGGGAFSLFRQGSAGSSASVNNSTGFDPAPASSGAEPSNGGT